MLAAPASAPVLPMRIGHGFDLHRLAEGYKLIIGGVDIPHTKGCEAHSDGRFLRCGCAILSTQRSRFEKLYFI